MENLVAEVNQQREIRHASNKKHISVSNHRQHYTREEAMMSYCLRFEGTRGTRS
jgi:hypothetical protein